MSHAICFLSGYLLHTLFVLDTPNMTGSHQAADCLSAPWSLTLAPSLWTDRELRKYHCPLHMSLPTPIAIRLLPYRFNRSFPQNGVPEKSNDFLGRGEAAKLSSFRVYTEAITAKLASRKSWRTYGRGYLRK